MVVGFINARGGSNLALVEMDAVPRKGERVSICLNNFTVIDVRWIINGDNSVSEVYILEN
jgi:hypothetical protein